MDKETETKDKDLLAMIKTNIFTPTVLKSKLMFNKLSLFVSQSNLSVDYFLVSFDPGKSQ